MHGRLFQPYRGKEEEDEEEEEGDLRFVLETVNMKNQFSLFKQKWTAAESLLMEGWSLSAGSRLPQGECTRVLTASFSCSLSANIK